MQKGRQTNTSIPEVNVAWSCEVVNCEFFQGRQVCSISYGLNMVIWSGGRNPWWTAGPLGHVNPNPKFLTCPVSFGSRWVRKSWSSPATRWAAGYGCMFLSSRSISYRKTRFWKMFGWFWGFCPKESVVKFLGSINNLTMFDIPIGPIYNILFGRVPQLRAVLEVWTPTIANHLLRHEISRVIPLQSTRFILRNQSTHFSLRRLFFLKHSLFLI